MSARNDYRIMRGPGVAEGYECLVAPDGSDVTTLTEPEDRTFYRDLLPVLALLNKQHEALAALRAERDRLKALLAEARGCVAANFGPNEGTRLLARIDKEIAP